METIKYGIYGVMFMAIVLILSWGASIPIRVVMDNFGEIIGMIVAAVVVGFIMGVFSYFLTK